jgi:hypothetical protein
MWQLQTMDGQPVTVGDRITDFRGRPAILEGGSYPHKLGSSGKVWARGAEYFPSVFNLIWVRYA